MRDTIAAVASPLGTGAVAVIRISGERSWEIAMNLSGIRSPKPRKVYHTFLKDESGDIDEVLIVFYRSPKSYTGEDMVEVFCHGGIVVTEMVLKSILNAGARLAEPGEFTKRAFLNKKIDLTRAEAIRDLIEARSEEAVRTILKNVSGDLYSFLEKIRNDILKILAEIEVEIDYPDEEDLVTRDLDEKINSMLNDMEALLERSKKLIEIVRGIRVAIIGKPNVGKSTLLNRLLREDRAIVTSVPGTTRDTVEGELNIKGRLFKVVDTAGLRKTEDPVESIGVERAKREIEKADVVLFVVDNTFEREDLEIYESVKNSRHIVVLNKSDLGYELDTSWAVGKVVKMSSKTGKGVKDLEDTLLEITEDYRSNIGKVSLTSERHIRLVNLSVERLRSALNSLRSGFPNDIVSYDIKEALGFLDEITGRNFRKDLLDVIFSTFCVGK